jgi:hypothetical protein
MFRCNVGGIDRVLRVTLGAIFFFAGLLLLAGRTRVGITIAVIGLLVLLTGLVRFCLMYIPFGISTVQQEESHIEQGSCCAVFRKELMGESTGEGSHAPLQQKAKTDD